VLLADIAVMFGFQPRHYGHFVYNKDIQHLFTDGTHLRVGMNKAALSYIKQISLFQTDQLTYIDFRLNAEMQVRYKLPLQQYQPFLPWLRHLPQTQISTGCKSSFVPACLAKLLSTVAVDAG
jgi:hypothetical protein